MIISRTPYRISFFGGGTDYPPWFNEHGGCVLSTAIDKYCYISVRKLPPFFGYKYRIVYSKIENINSLNEIEHPAVRGCIQWSGQQSGLEVHHNGDLPARSGLGSSSSFTVGLVNALNALDGKMSSRHFLAEAAINIEHHLLKEHVGYQDQIITAFGGFNKINFKQNGTFDVRPIIIANEKKDWLQQHLLLFFTGISRYSSDVAKNTIDNIKQKQNHLRAMMGMVDDAINILQSPNQAISEFGKLLDETWQYKRKLSQQVSSNKIDEIYEAGCQAGAIGGKLLGAGGGGFMLFFAEPPNHAKIREKLKDLIYVPVQFESTGSRIVLYQPQGLQ